MTDLVTVGRVGRPHGIAGAFVVEEASETPGLLARGATVLVAHEPATIVEAKHAGRRLVLRLDRAVPRGARLEVPRSSLPPLENGSYYVADLIGLAVEEESGRPIGRVARVEPGVANDVLELDSGQALPLVEDCVRDVDLERRRIVVASDFVDPG